jgi:hypothetical protein
MEWKMNPTKPTPSLRELLYVFGNRPASSASDSHLYKLFSAIVDRLEKDTPCTNAPDASKTAAHEPPMNTKTATAPNADPPPLGVNHQKCDRCGNPPCLHGPYYMLCLCDAAASPAGQGGTSGTTSSGQPTPQTVGDADASRVETPTPAGEGRVPVPEWCEKGLVHKGDMILGTGIGAAPFFKSPFAHQCKTPESAEWFCGIMNYGLAALRADRDYHRTGAGILAAGIDARNARIRELEKTINDREIDYLEACKDLDAQACRIYELEAAQASQMVTIENLTAQLNEASKACEMWMNLAQPARKYPTVEQVMQWHGQWYRGFSAKVFSDWLLDRAREQEGKG